jgi:hypothetical protein
MPNFKELVTHHRKEEWWFVQRILTPLTHSKPPFSHLEQLGLCSSPGVTLG